MALLDLVNELRHLLREDPVTTVAGASGDLLVHIALLNRAARRVFTRRSWTFLHRDDGYAFFPGQVSLTVWATSLSRSVIATPSTAQQEAYADGSTSAKVYFPGSDFPETSYRITTWEYDFPAVWTLATPFRGTTNVNANCVLYVNEIVLPTTVSRVLSVRNEEGSPVRFETVDSFDDFDRAFPQDIERFSDTPEVVAIGGHSIATERTSGNPLLALEPAAGIGMRIFPPASADILLRYSYVLRHPDLEDDADAFDGTPQAVQDHIVNWAFFTALYSDVEDDDARAKSLRMDLETEYRELADADRIDRGRRHVPTPFSNRRTPGWRRWQFDSIPEP